MAPRILAATLALFLSSGIAAPGRYMATDEFLGGAFPAGEPAAKVVWVTDDLRRQMEDIVGHPLAIVRLRYWQHGPRTAWIMNEIGKERPITIGVAIGADGVESVRVLEFRETRGWEIRYPFFTDQFSGSELRGGEQLDKSIDGITGATLSVRAVTRVVTLALYLHEHIAEP